MTFDIKFGTPCIFSFEHIEKKNAPSIQNIEKWVFVFSVHSQITHIVHGEFYKNIQDKKRINVLIFVVMAVEI